MFELRGQRAESGLERLFDTLCGLGPSWADILESSISGLVVEYIVAIDVTRVRFPADAFLKTLVVTELNPQQLNLNKDTTIYRQRHEQHLPVKYNILAAQQHLPVKY